MTTCSFTYDDHNECEHLAMPITDKSETYIERSEINGHKTIQAYHPTVPGRFCPYHEKLMRGLLQATDYRHMRRSLELMRKKIRREKENAKDYNEV